MKFKKNGYVIDKKKTSFLIEKNFQKIHSRLAFFGFSNDATKKLG